MRPAAAGLKCLKSLTGLALALNGSLCRQVQLLATCALLLVLAACTTSPGVTTPEVKALPANPAATKVPVVALPLVVGPAATATAPADEVAPATAPPANTAADNRPALFAGELLKEFQRGHASWYGPGFHGRRTASGERFDMQGLTAAHRTLPFGTLVRVHSLVNGRAVDVRITDRGPFSHNRIIDLSRAAADELGMLGLGFKEVLLLVPESTADTTNTRVWPAAKKPLRPARPARPKSR